MKKFLENRTQKAAVAGVTSSVLAVTTGVPLGTVFRPLLFLIYINMSSTVLPTIGLVAANAFIQRTINNTDDRKIFQEDLEKLIQWEQAWEMKFHPDEETITLFFFYKQLPK